MNTILLVEDDDTLNANIKLSLETEGYNVIAVRTAAAAEAAAPGADLIILDVTLPDGNGIELCRRLRKNIQTPVIFLTSCDDEADIVRGLDSGGDDYMTKPFRLRELFSRIRANLRRIPDIPEMELTAVEQKLLGYLMMNREHYLTREQILEYLWDSKGIFVNDNTLSVNISRLREKLSRSSGCGRIVTKRGMGYKWTDS
ncbi:MAG: response regulator transcription factor [Ruminococcus sp.]|jgi:DNA-binding response OmpR family regulator|uniref:response regulator transcription factor n=1 Tax=Ruminococcus sp. TaxID=41978 RepID=UPI001B523E44|nr:response regulator transcription factor [Ruminococcus sp.]MBO4493123.1 response regulator transcription factor [Ruminococcus sp.]MBP5431374.1 response regulator transcription factor [Ruminococcus sp.]